ncbi:MAG: riboflavin synthase subunit alpha [Neisseriaceae bacterium]|nr:riboflavin synthase subunit alpha [Neisseriaceae bacterium]
MFTGIVQGLGQIQSIIKKDQFQTHVVRLPRALLGQLALGASVAHNGCCLTVTEINDDLVSFDLIDETLRLTNLGELGVGDWVNLERAAKFGDEIGGHSMSGHIFGQAIISRIEETATNRTVYFKLPEAMKKYLLTKGYVGIDGISLTLGEVSDHEFCVHLIPETIARTNMQYRQVGDGVNIEVDPQTQAIVDTVERVLAQRMNA